MGGDGVDRACGASQLLLSNPRVGESRENPPWQNFFTLEVQSSNVLSSAHFGGPGAMSFCESAAPRHAPRGLAAQTDAKGIAE